MRRRGMVDETACLPPKLASKLYGGDDKKDEVEHRLECKQQPNHNLQQSTKKDIPLENSSVVRGSVTFVQTRASRGRGE